MHTQYLASLLDVFFPRGGLQKYSFQVVNFRIELMRSISTIPKVLKLISLCNLFILGGGGGLQKYSFQVVNFRIERMRSISTLPKVLKLISLCNLFLFLTDVLLLRQPITFCGDSISCSNRKHYPNSTSQVGYI